MPTKLTDKAVEAAKADGKRREVPDGLLPSLYLIVQPSGSKSWAVRYRLGTRTRKHTLGKYPAIKLADARKLARSALVKVAEGSDPSTDKAATRDRSALWERVAAEFLERYAARHCRPSTAQDYERSLRVHVTPRWRGRRIAELRRADVVKLLDDLQASGLGARTNRVLAAVRKLFSWAIERSYVETNPASNVRMPVPEARRDRALDDAELAAVWQAAGRLDPPLREYVHLLILTGQRRSELAGMRWAEVDLSSSTWTLPPERTKNGRRHVVPLSGSAMEALVRVPRLSDEFVFSTTGTTPVSGFAKVKLRLDRQVAELQQGVPPWTFHDLRRTFASGCAGLDVPIHVVERCLNHVSGTFAGVVEVYQRHEFATEKREAMEAWAAHVLALNDG